MNRFVVDYADLKITEKKKQTNGGAGSGNFGHAGRPGKVGGSSLGVNFEPWGAGASYYYPLDDNELYSGMTRREYYAKAKDLATRVISISPEDYLKLLQRGGHSLNVSHHTIQSKMGKQAIEDYRKDIRQGRAIATPVIELDIDGNVSGQEGRHRMEAAILEEVKQVPVMISYRVSSDKINSYLKNIEYRDITDEYRKRVTEYMKKIS